MPIQAAFRTSLAATAFAALAACTTVAAPGSRMVADGQSFAMQPGEQVMLADHGTLKYVRLVADSRCRPDVQCIRAGDAEIAMQWQPAGGAARDFSLKTPEGGKPTPAQSQDLDGRRVTLLSLARGDAPEAQLQVERIP